jgi:hypothetical protein
MAHDSTLENFLKDLGLRIGAAVVVLGIFFGLGYLGRVDFLGLAGLLDTQLGFFAVAFLLVGLVSVGWIALRRRRL